MRQDNTSNDPVRTLGTRQDCCEQIRLIHEHRIRLSRTLGREVPPEVAASDWVRRYAEIWRRWRESHTESATWAPSGAL